MSTIRLRKCFSYVPISRAAELEVYFTVHVSTVSLQSIPLPSRDPYSKRLWVSIGAEDRHAWLAWLPFRFTGSPPRDSEEERTQKESYSTESCTFVLGSLFLCLLSPVYSHCCRRIKWMFPSASQQVEPLTVNGLSRF